MDNMTVAEARKQLEKGRKNGTKCPCCGRPAQEYNRHVSAGMIKVLAGMLRWHRDNDDLDFQRWVHVEREIPISIRGTNRDFARLKYWNLIQCKRDFVFDEKESTLGYYRLTRKGASFLNGSTKIEKYKVVYLDNVVASSSEMVYVQDCLGEHFNYQELTKLVVTA